MRLKFLPSFVKRKGRITKNQEENLRYLSDFSIKSLKQIKKLGLKNNYINPFVKTILFML